MRMHAIYLSFKDLMNYVYYCLNLINSFKSVCKQVKMYVVIISTV